MSIYLLFPVLLFCFAITLDHAQSQSSFGFINLDCGLARDVDGYMDQNTGLFYSTDADYIDTGENRNISPEFETADVPQPYWNLRSFPGPNGTRNCYTLRPVNGKGNRILLRVGFLYGNYDGQNELPQFDLHLGADYWDTVKFMDSSSFFSTEMLHVPTSDYVHVCLINTGLGTPFMSVLELRPINTSNPGYNMTPESVKCFGRWDLGSTNTSPIRYPDDIYDRTWFPYNTANSTIISTKEVFFSRNSYNLPSVIMNTAVQAPSLNDSIVLTPFTPTNRSHSFYFYFHFAELVANQSREITIYVNGVLWFKPFFVPNYLSAYTIYSKPTPPRYSDLKITINTTENSKLPAIINAFEMYTVHEFPHRGTDENEVAAMISIKRTYGIKRNWQGDPCSPKAFAWTGLICSYNGNLYSSGLTGPISPSVSTLTMLQSLDLSCNNLTGHVPDFLAWLPSLKYLNLTGNTFISTSLPPELLKKSQNGFLTLSFDNPTYQTKPRPKDTHQKKKKKFLIPVIVASVLVAIFLPIATFLVLWKRNSRCDTVVESKSKGLMVEPERKNNHSIVELKFRRFTFSEVKSFLDEKNIIGEGGNGTVYYGCMDGVEVALKMLKVSPDQEFKDFQSEVNILATIHHKNLIPLLGYWNEGTNKGIIFEFMENGSLEMHLSGKNPNVLSWEHRLKIMIDSAKGKRKANPPIIHRDIKPANILVTKDFEAKLADFGLSRPFPIQSTRIAGTLGYIDPVYEELYILTEKIDIYSFGVLMLVVVTGRPTLVDGKTHITQWISHKIEQADIRGIVDSRLINTDFDMINDAWRVLELAIACACPNSVDRPTMSHVVKELTENLPSVVAHNEFDEGRSLNESSSIFKPHAR